MNTSLLHAELLAGLRKPSFWISSLAIASVTFALVHLVTIGFPFIRLQLVGEAFAANSIRNMDILATFSSWLMIFMVSNVFAFQANRDFAHSTQAMVFSSGVSKFNFVTARFTAAFIQCVLLAVFAFVGFIIARYMPYIDDSYFQIDTVGLYVQPFIIKTLPNIFILGALFFSLNLILRNQLVNWVSVMALYLLSVSLLRINDIDWLTFAYLAEPLGIKLALASRGIEGGKFVYDSYLLGNRLIWLGVAATLLTASILLFQLKDEPRDRFHRLRKIRKRFTGKIFDTPQSVLDKTLIQVSAELTCKQQIQIWLGACRFELREILFNRYFLLLSFLGFSYLFWVSRLIGRSFDTNTFPVTYAVLGVFQGAFSLFFFVIIVLFSAEALWRDRENKIDGMTGGFPISNALYLSAKAAALFATLFVLSSFMMIGGILVQRMKGYFDHELNLYIVQLFGLNFIDFALLVALTFMVFSLVRSKYQGYTVMAVYYIFDTFIADILLQHKLLIFGDAPSLIYSDLNGFGPNLLPYLVFKIFWCLVAVWFIRISVWVWPRSRGEHFSLVRIIKKNCATSPKVSFVLTAFIVLGISFIIYNTSVLNDFVSSGTAERNKVLYEKTYSHFALENQPDIDQLSMMLEIEPENTRVHGHMTARLTNHSDEAVEHVHVEYDPQKINSIEFNRDVRVTLEDKDLGVFRWALNEPLLPGDSLMMSLMLDDKRVGFSNNGRRMDVVDNGSFYKPPVPKIGYQTRREIVDERRRNKFDLVQKQRFVPRNDERARERSFLGFKESLIDLDITVGTALDQYAFAPGDLTQTWQENGRAYFHYASQQKVLNFVSIISGRYEHAEASWDSPSDGHQDVALSVYHHPKHTANIDSMLEASKLSLDEYTRRFGPYPHEQLRILEVPRYVNYAQSFAANIPFSESIGFIADVRSLSNDSAVTLAPANIDYPFFVTAHEIAHQWWAHQLIAADAEGSTFIVESLSQYSALRVYERKYGADGVKKLLKYYSTRYGTGRTGEKGQNREQPLLRVRGEQQYIHYSKGIAALYAVSERMGEALFDSALKAFLHKFSYKNQYYPTTLDFLEILLSYAPVDTHAYIKEQLEQISLIAYVVEEASYQRQPDFTYTVEVTIDFEKQFQLEQGALVDAESETLVEIGFYNAKGEEIHLEQIDLKNGLNHIPVKLPRKPASLVVEPYYKWQERNLIKETHSIIPGNTE